MQRNTKMIKYCLLTNECARPASANKLRAIVRFTETMQMLCNNYISLNLLNIRMRRPAYALRATLGFCTMYRARRASVLRGVSTCIVTGRQKAIYSRFSLARTKLSFQINGGYPLGVTKSSW